MSAQYEQSAYFLIAVGVSFCEAVSTQPGYAEASPHDYQEVLWQVLGESFGPRGLQAALSDEGIAAIAAGCARYFETSPPASATIRAALQQCLFRWPPGEAGDAGAGPS